MSLLSELEELTEKEIATYSFWIVGSRKEQYIIRTRVNKNLKRLQNNGLIQIERTPQRYQYDPARGYHPRDIEPLVYSSGRRVIRETRVITEFLYKHPKRSYTVTDLIERASVNDSRAWQILKYLTNEGFCMHEGEIGKKTRIRLTEFGRKIADQVAIPIMIAAKRGFNWYNFKPLKNQREYRRFWRSYPLIDRDYVLGEFRGPLTRLPANYTQYVEHLMAVDKVQNPFRKK